MPQPKRPVQCITGAKGQLNAEERDNGATRTAVAFSFFFLFYRCQCNKELYNKPFLHHWHPKTKKAKAVRVAPLPLSSTQQGFPNFSGCDPQNNHI